MTGAVLFVLALAGLTALEVFRRLLAWRAIRDGERPGALGTEAEVTVLQPILGGDPDLARCLADNLRAAPEARFVWLLDADDTAGCAAAAAAFSAVPHESVLRLVGPRPPAGRNPKTHKLAAGLERVETPFLAVVDDDTVLPPGFLARAAGAAAAGTLVTGLPVYAARGSAWSRLVTGFVNAAATVTYLPVARLGAQRTINGMISTMRTDDLRAHGGFAAIVGEVTDDYALARLFLDGGGRIVQLAVPVTVTTTVRDARHFFALMRRWMVFARLYLAENRSAATLLLVLLPELAVWPLILAALVLPPWAIATVAAFLAARAVANRQLVARLTGRRPPLADMAFEIAAPLLTPVHAISALVAPRRIRWRDRTLTLDGRRIADG